MEEEIKERAERAIAEHTFPGCVIGVIHKDRNVFERKVIPAGSLIYQTEIPVTENTIYDLASITKSIPAASLALTFIEEGKLQLDGKILQYLPELRNDHGATIEDLLRYRVHGPRMSTLPCKTPDEIEAYIFEHGFDGPLGEESYSNLPTYLLGIILERIGGETLDVLAQHYFFDPLNMKDASFFPQDIERIAPSEVIEGKELRGIVHDESSRIFAEHNRVVGHAGLFSTANDLLNFLEALLNGKLDAVTKGAQQGLGWELQQKWMGQHRSELFGKSGFTGTVVMCDMRRRIALVILSNRTYPHRPPDSSAIHSFRADIADIVFA